MTSSLGQAIINSLVDGKPLDSRNSAAYANK